MDPAGPTAPWNPDESPASAGPLSGGEPHNWGSITGPQMLPRLAQALTAEAFWQAIVPLVRAVAPKVIEKRSEEHTSELQSRENLVCRLLLEKKNDIRKLKVM